mmetsp:Transcript_4400/g.19965  ORF Transcript_4400/g.19965 Transcript_4400/m.19965 type:complete len:306 (+) Transcript_4400:1681-2598(+)
MMALAADFKRSFIAWYFPLRFSSNTRDLRRVALPSASLGSPVNIAAYSLDKTAADLVTSARKCSVARTSASCASSGSRPGRRSLTAILGGKGARHGGSTGAETVTSKVTPHSVGVAIQCVCPSGAGSSLGPSPPPGFSFGQSFATHDAAYCPKGGARSGAVSALSVAPGLRSPSKVASAIALYDSAMASKAPDLDTLHTSIWAFCAGPLPRMASRKDANVAAGIHTLAVDVSAANSTRDAVTLPSSSFSTTVSPPRIIAGSSPSKGTATTNSQWLSLAPCVSIRVCGRGAICFAVKVRMPPCSAS